MNSDENMDIKNKKHIHKIYTDKATNLLKICLGLLLFDGVTYLIAIFRYNAFDFGFIFEIISFVFILIGLNRLEQDNLELTKKNIIISMVPIGGLIIYDFINLLANFQEVFVEILAYYISFDQYFYYLLPYLVDPILIALIVLLYKSYSSINKADGSEVSDNYTDVFYDNL